MNIEDPKIIRCAGLFFFTTRFRGAVTTFLPTHLISETDLWIGSKDGDSYFVVALSDSSQDGEDRVRAALEHIWDQLIERGLATGSMPDPVEGNPRNMLP